MQEVLTILVKLGALAIAVVIVILLPKVKAWLVTKIGEENLKKIMEYTTIFVAAADQLLKSSDPDGSQRKQYVIDQLTKIGIEVTDDVDAIIESEVLKLK